MEKTKGEICREELLKIESSIGLTAENVLKVASNKQNPLHEYFDWNDTIAGEKWRLYQARQLINYVIEPITDDDNNRVYSFEVIGNEYKHIDEIMTNDSWKERIMNQAIGQLKYWKTKYERFKIKEFQPIIRQISKLPEVKTKDDRRKTRKAIIATKSN